MYVQRNTEAHSRVIVAVEKHYVLLIALRVHACILVSGRVGVCMRIRACDLANPACNAYAPYCDVIYGPLFSTVFFDIVSQTVRFSEKCY